MVLCWSSMSLLEWAPLRLNVDNFLGHDDIGDIPTVLFCDGLEHPPENDLDLDGDVDLTDFNILAANWGTLGIPRENRWLTADFSDNSNVDLADFTTLAMYWGEAGYRNIRRIQGKRQFY